MKKPLSKALKTWYGVGDFLFDIQMSFKTYYWNIFLTSIAQLPLGTIALLNTIVSTCEIFMSPFYGAVMDGMKPMKWGRYRSIIMLFAPITAILAIAQWFAAGISDPNMALIVLVVLALVFAVFFNMQNTANLSLIQVVCSTEEERSTLSSRRWAWINFDKVALGVLAASLIAFFAGIFGEGSIASYGMVVVVFGVTNVIGMFIHFKLTDGYEVTAAEAAASPAKKSNAVSLKTMAATIAKNPPLLVLFLANCCTSTVSFIIAMMAAHVFNYALEAPAMFAFYLTATNLGAVLGSLAAGILGKKMDAKKLSMLCLPLCIVFLIGARVFAANPILFTIFILCERTFSNCNYSTFVTMYTNCAVYAEHKTGVNSTGLVMGITNVPVKIAVLITGALIPGVLAATGFDATAAVIPEAVKSGLTNAFTLLPMACYAAAFLIITFLFKLTGKEVARMQDEINARKNSEA